MQGLGSVPGPPCRTGLGREFYGAHTLRGISVVLGHAVLFGVPVFERRLHETPLISGLQTALEIEPETFCL